MGPAALTAATAGLRWAAHRGRARVMTPNRTSLPAKRSATPCLCLPTPNAATCNHPHLCTPFVIYLWGTITARPPEFPAWDAMAEVIKH